MTPAQLRARPTLILLVCLLLPLIGLGYSWAHTHRAAQRGTVWEVPIGGYDPRDLLRGHYVQFQYRWPGITSGNGSFYGSTAPSLCLNGNAPQITNLREGAADMQDCPRGHFVSGSARYSQDGPDSGRLYVSQAQGAAYQVKLTDPKLAGSVLVRVDENGALRPVKLLFRPRPVASQPSTK